MRTSVFPRRYIQGAGALRLLGPELKRLGDRGFALIDRLVADRIVAIAKQSEATVLMAFGGGSVLDVGRWAGVKLARKRRHQLTCLAAAQRVSLWSWRAERRSDPDRRV